MAKRKYEHLKKRVPRGQDSHQEESPRAEGLRKAITERSGRSLSELTEEYNRLDLESASLGEQKSAVDLKIDAIEIMIREKLAADNVESIGQNGFNWAEVVEPYAVAEDVSAIIQYFKDNGLESELQLKNSELVSRLKRFVKAEAEAGELIMEPREVTDPDTGETSEVIDVRSSIPGVRVFLKSSLGRTKIGK